MKAALIHQFGGPEVIAMGESPEPQPRPDDLLIEVCAAGLNPVDTKIRTNGLGRPRPFPFIPGYDVSGVVRSVGANVKQFRIGDEVYASPSLIRNGANAELVCVDGRTAALKPQTLTHVQAAALPLVALTAWESLHTRSKIHTGETVLIHAGAGGVGHIAVQLAKLHDCRVITTASRTESIDMCKQLGADVIIDYAQEDFVERVNEETDGKGCAMVLDGVGGKVFDRSLDCVAVNGRLVSIVYTPSDRIVQALFRKNVTVHFEFMGVPTIHGINPEIQGEILRTVAELVDAGKLNVHIHQTYPLEELADAHTCQQTQHVRGKVVIAIKS